MLNSNNGIELSQARILGALNSSSLPTRVVTAVKEATHIGVTYIKVSRDDTPVIFRHYAVTCEYTIPREAEKPGRDKSKGRPTRTVSHEEVTHVWEIQGARHTKHEMPGSWVYADSRAAVSSFAYLLMPHAGMWNEGDIDEIVDLRDMLGNVLQRAGVRTTGTIPRIPTDDSDAKAAKLASLVATAIDAKQKDVSPATRKRIAVALYEAGERNIRRISSLTGLSRETIYKALQDEHIER
ncbi:hypothetical protein [Nonomuraea sp. NPDC049784]|uniref:hypothetical protein n=1 Tax=Nonomuraea sp. NPDC049784 TaxID=3154361 RepID=UPI00340820C6